MLHVGRHTYGAERMRIEWPQADVHVGTFCSIAENVTIFAGGNHDPRRVTTFPFGHAALARFPCPKTGLPTTRGDVRIGSDVWIGAHASIMSGVHIGHGAVIAAYAHVVSHVKPYCVVGGNPARPYYYRFPPADVQRLLTMRWWDFPDDVVREIVPLLVSTDLSPLFAWWDHYQRERGVTDAHTDRREEAD